jgi:hypothetical protein
LFHVLMRINRMAMLSVNIGIWWRLGYLSLLMCLCLLNIGMKLFSPQSIWSIVSLAKLSSLKLTWNVNLANLVTTLFCASLDVLVGLIFDPTIDTNLTSGLNSVHSWV